MLASRCWLAAAVALVKLGEKEQLSLVLDTLEDSNSVTRYQAIGYIGKMQSRELLPHLIALLDDPEDEVVFYSLKAIGKLAEPQLFPRLAELTLSEHPSVRYQADICPQALP